MPISPAASTIHAGTPRPVPRLEQLALFSAQDQTDEVAFPTFYPDKRVTYQELRDSSQKAIDAGCPDPMVAYSHGIALMNMGNTREARPFFDNAAAAIDGSPYSAYRRYKVHNRVWQFTDDDKTRDAHWPAVRDLCIAMAKGPFLNAAAHREVALGVFQAYVTRPQEQYEADLAALAAAPGVDRWTCLNAMVELQIDLAWDARGGGWASTVTAEGWRGFEDHLAKAAAAANEAYKLHPELPEPATAMIRVAMGSGGREDQMKWFDRALGAQADFGRAYSALLNALMPRWGGSNDEIMALARKMAAGKRYDTAIPFQYLSAAVRIMRDTDGDKKILTSAEVQATGGEILTQYIRQWKGHPREAYFQNCLAALACRVGRRQVGRTTLDALPGKPMVDAFSMFGVNVDYHIEKAYFDTFADPAAIARLRMATGRHNYQNAINDLDAIFTAQKLAGREAEVFDNYRAGCKIMQDYRANKAIALTDAAARAFWYTDFPGTRDDAGNLLNMGVDNGLSMSNRFYLFDRHYELHLKFEYLDLRGTQPKPGSAQMGCRNRRPKLGRRDAV